MSEFRVGQNWTEKMAGQDRKEGLVMDEAIYNSHIGNEEFYAKVSDITGFQQSAKCVLWNYSYEILLTLLFSRKALLCKISYFKKFLLNIPKYKKIKTQSLQKCAFLKTPLNS